MLSHIAGVGTTWAYSGWLVLLRQNIDNGGQCEDAGGCLYWVVIREVSDERWSPS